MIKRKGMRANMMSGVALAALIGVGAAINLGQSAAPAMAAPSMGSDYVDLVAELSPAVVTIEVTQTARRARVPLHALAKP